jgi:hypothetical protein
MLTLIIFPNAQSPSPPPANPLNLVGGTMSLLIPSAMPPTRANPYPTEVAMTIVSDNLPPAEQFAFYVARPGVDFTTPGLYSLQAAVTFEGGQLLQTNFFNINVTTDLFAAIFDEVDYVDTLQDWDTDEGSGAIITVQQFVRQRTGWPGIWPALHSRPWG